MKDRLPTRPNRVKITHDNGSVEYATITRADEPTEVGTPLSKATLLTDETALMYDLDNTATVNDVFQAVARGLPPYNYRVVVTNPDGDPVPNVQLIGLSTPSGGDAITDETGTVVVYLDSNTNITVVSLTYADLLDKAMLISVPSSAYATIRIQMNWITAGEYKYIDTSRNVRFMKPHIIDICCVGAGGGGGGGSNTYSGSQASVTYTISGGGGGGSVVNATDISVGINTDYPIVIGAGGQVTASGGSLEYAGSTIAFGVTATGGQNGQYLTRSSSSAGSITAKPGAGGTGGGNGGTATTVSTVNPSNSTGKGDDATVFPFGDSSIYASGGGGGGLVWTKYHATSELTQPNNHGSPNGGNGTYRANGNDASKGVDGKAPGGGGGGAGNTSKTSSGYTSKVTVSGGNGANGGLFIKLH